MALTLTGFVYDNAGNAISGATVQGYVSADDQTSGTTAEASTTTNSDGKWSITTSTASRIPMDVLITYGSNKRWIKAGDKLNVTDMTVTGTLTVGEDDTGFDVKLYGATSGSFMFWDESEDALKLTDTTLLKIGDGSDMTLYHNGSDSYITNATGALRIATENSGIAVTIGHTTSEVTIADNLTVTGTLTLGSGAELSEAELEMLDGITAGTAAASKALVLDANKDIGTIRNLTIDGTLSDGNYTFDTSGNVSGLGTVTGTTITGSTAIVGGTVAGTTGTFSGVVDITNATDSSDATGDTGALKTEGGASIAKKLYVGTDLSVGGNLTVTGTQTIVDTVTMNAANAVVFEGATADAHETTLTIEDPTADRTVVIPNVSGTLAVLAADSDVAITSTPAELNLLDGVSGLVQADFTKLAALDATAAELDLADGNSTIGTTAVSDGHGIVMNHGGTMAQTTVQTLAAYLDDEITAMPNLVTVGTIGTGVWQGTPVATAYIADNSITLAKLAGGTDGNIISFDASGDPVAIATGSDGQVLTSAGAGAPPSFETPTVGDITAVTAGVGLSGGGTAGALDIALDLSELSTVTPADGDFFSTLDSDGANEQKTTTTALATLFAGTGLTANSSVIGVDAAQTQITSVGTIGTGVWQGTAVAAGYMAQGTTSAKGALEIATTAEINTSTDAARAMTPDLYAASNYGIRYVQIMAVAAATDLTVTDGLAYFHVPAGLNGMDLREVHAECFTAPTGANVVVEISKNGNSTQMLGTNLRIDIDETGSDTGAGAVNTDGSEAVATNDLLQINCTQIGSSTVGAGLLVTMGFRIP